MDRREKIFAKTVRVAGVARKPSKEKPKQGVTLKTVLSGMQKELSPTILRSCSYTTGDIAYTYQNADIKSIVGRNKKPICFIVTGESKEEKKRIDKSQIPSEISSMLEEYGGKTV